MTRISGVSDQLFMNFFVWGMKMKIRRELLLATPTDLADAMAKAQIFEDRNDDPIGHYRGSNARSNWPSKLSFP